MPICRTLPILRALQGGLAHEKAHSPWDHRRALCTFCMVPGKHFLLSEVPPYGGLGGGGGGRCLMSELTLSETGSLFPFPSPTPHSLPVPHPPGELRGKSALRPPASPWTQPSTLKVCPWTQPSTLKACFAMRACGAHCLLGDAIRRTETEPPPEPRAPALSPSLSHSHTNSLWTASRVTCE